MNLLRRRHLVVFLIALVCAWPLSRPASAQSLQRGITYTSPGTRAEQGDLFLPAGAGPFPAILYLHGGSWRSGSKGSFGKLAADLAGKGYAGFSINYDLSAHSFPESWNEARAAIKFLQAHASEYRIDPQRVVVAGTSAGGELAALLALAPEGPAGASDHMALPVVAAVILNGVFDLHSDVHVITRYLGAPCETVAAACTDASPLQHVHAGAPPFFVGHGTADHVVAYGEAQTFIPAVRNAGGPVTPFVADGGPHMYWEKSRYYADNLSAVENFLAQVFAPK